MREASAPIILLLATTALAVFLLLTRPALLADYSLLAFVLIAELFLVALLKYRRVFFFVLMFTFLCAGCDVPSRSAFLYLRWFVLAAGALGGVAVYFRGRHHAFGLFHLLAFFCAVSAVASALISAYPQEALLKALSLTLLFAYGAAGARMAVPDFQPEAFFRRLLAVCEILNGFAAICYFVFRWDLFGNPNSLGAVVGVVIIPIMLWGLITAETVMQRRRLGIELIIAGLLLMSSVARAGIAAAIISGMLLCIVSRHYRLLMKSAVAVVFLAAVAAAFITPPSNVADSTDNQQLSEMFLYKGHQHSGLLGSRKGVWAETLDVIQQNPWFGSGFGTSVARGGVKNAAISGMRTDPFAMREHGNSYLAITEWVGLLGVLPFCALILLTAWKAAVALSTTRRTGAIYAAVVPAACVIVAGLVHAAFEDWMFAVGYYLCVFFWSIAFVLVDICPRSAVAGEAAMFASFPVQEFQPASALPVL